MSTDPGRTGRFITVEGPDGAGKTTNLDRMERIVRDAGFAVVRTREPGGTPLGDEIRNLVLHRDGPEIDATAELLLIFAARAQHLSSVIRPALAAGNWVVCDRFTDATYAYQGGGRGVDSTAIADLEQLVQGDLRPDLTILFDIDSATGAMRATGRDRFESEAGTFRDKVRRAYLSRARAEPERVRIVNAARSLDQVGREVEAIMKRFISAPGLEPQRAGRS
ncbi:MAG: dTMP kinase [Gammaproteobacteria bacterium]|nr:dTMP kinase [Gammaproteobacteria bacterium]